MSLQTQSLRLAGERAGSWNEVGEWGDVCYSTYRVVSKLIVATINYLELIPIGLVWLR